jgi:hypothetical protein
MPWSSPQRHNRKIVEETELLISAQKAVNHPQGLIRVALDAVPTHHFDSVDEENCLQQRCDESR